MLKLIKARVADKKNKPEETRDANRGGGGRGRTSPGNNGRFACRAVGGLRRRRGEKIQKLLVDVQIHSTCSLSLRLAACENVTLSDMLRLLNERWKVSAAWLRSCSQLSGMEWPPATPELPRREGGAGSLWCVALARLPVSGRIFWCKHCVVYAQLGIKLGGC